jgi:hypothetical protein
MKLSYLQSMPDSCISFDTETHAIQQGLIAPPLVLGSAGWLGAAPDGSPAICGELLDKERATQLLAALLDDPSKVIACANGPFDLLVVAVHLARLGIDAMPAIFRALMDEGRVFDVQTAQMLDAIAEGCLGKDPRTGGPIVSPDTGRRGGYSLAVVTDLVLGRTNAKALGHVATEYGKYDDVPLAELPEDMQHYPVDDARNTVEDALAQAGHWPRAGAHRWGTATACEWCGMLPKDAYADGQYIPCRARRRARNLHDLASQVGTAWAMHLGAAWGFCVDQSSVDAIERDALDGRTEAEEPFVRAGLLRRNRDGSTSRDMSAICRAVALAYGANPSRPCSTCAGTRKVISPKAKPVKCPMCAGVGVVGQSECPKCRRVGTIPDPRQQINCADCGATGLDLATAPHLPKTETGRVGTGRDVLNESGDELLMSLADHQEDGKVLETYVPYLRRGRAPIAGHAERCPTRADASEDCACPGPYRPVPLTLWPNVLLETGRTSYRGVIQLLPRKTGFKNARGERIPSLRECMTARPGMVLSSEDFKAGELYTHAQSCIWIVGHSDLGDALLRDLDPHSALAATVLGVSYDEFIRRKKEPAFKNGRQAAKPFTFGKPGGMGAAKLVLQQRKQGPDTPCPSGPSLVDDGSGNFVPGYKGLRFCILMDGATSCGSDKVTKWGRRDVPIPPTCRHCLECAERLGEHWLWQWSENTPYFNYVQDCVENGQLVTSSHLELWPHLVDFFVPNKRLAPGEIMQHVSGRVRGGVDFCSCANGFFQGLLADVAKAALRQVSRECYDSTIRVRDSLYSNSVRSAYAGAESPLLGSRVIVFQHDEIIAEHPESVAHDAATRISEIMRDTMRWYCPDVAATCGAEPTLMRRWYKQAEKVTDSSGRLVPWEPSR